MRSLYYSVVLVFVLRNVHGQTESLRCSRNPFEEYCECQDDNTFTCNFNGNLVKIAFIDPRIILTQAPRNNTDQALQLPDDLLQDVPTITIIFIRGLRLQTLNSYTMGVLFLSISDSTIASLDVTVGGSSCKLQNVLLFRSEISSIPSDFFKSCADLKNIDLSSNRLESLPDGLLGKCNSLLTLSLQENNISNISPKLLRSCSLLEDVNLASNLIQSLNRSQFGINKSRIRFLNFESNRIQNIEENSFATLEFLEELNLNVNQLQKLPNQLFGGCKRLTILQIKGNRLDSFPPNLITKCSRLHVLELNENQLASLDIKFDCKSLTYVGLENNRLRSIPDKLFSNCPQLNTLSLSGNQFVSLPNDLFSVSPQLLNIIVSDNNLTLIPRNNKICVQSFNANANNLTVFNLSENPANYINVSFNNIRALTTPKIHCDVYSLDASHNLITDLHDGWTLGLQHLKMLNLSHNSLTYVTRGQLILLDNLEYLNLEFNNITHLEEELFSHMTQLLSLQLNYNPIYYAGESSLVPLGCGQPEHVKQTLLQLSIGNQRLPYFNCNAEEDSDTRRNCQCIQNFIPYNSSPATLKCPSKCTCNHYLNGVEIYLNCGKANLSVIPSEVPNDAIVVSLSHNTLTSLSSFSHSSWSSVVYLYMSHSLTESANITGQPFVQLTSLNWLDLSDNRINTIELDIFKGLSQLRYLDLSGNELHDISLRVFSHLVQLFSLDLSFNHLKSVPWSDKFPDSLRILKLTDNKITRLNSLEFAPSLTHLHIDNNSIATVSENIFNGVKNLKVITLGHNELETIDNLKRLPPTLVTFNVSYNKITNAINVDDFTSPLNLSELDLSGNVIEHMNLDLNKMSGKFINVYLQNNIIKTVNTLETISNRINIGIVKIFLQNNSLLCDCNNTQNLIAASNDIKGNVFLYVDDEAKCEKPIFLKDKLLSNLVRDDLPCDQEVNCPDGCLCYSRSDGKITVDCTQSGLPSDAKAPDDVEAIYVRKGSHLLALEDSSWKNLEQFYFVDMKPHSAFSTPLSPLVDLSNLKRLEMDEMCWCRPREFVSFNMQGSEGSCLRTWPMSHCIRESNDTDWKMVECSSPFIPDPTYSIKPVCYVYQSCPKICDCYLDPNLYSVMNCSRRNLTFIPEEGINFQVVDMDGNSLTELLDLSPWNNLTTIFARENQIQELLGDQLPASIRTIYLDDNLLSQPSGWLDNIMRDDNEGFARVSLAHNPWLCECAKPHFSSWSLDRATAILLNSNSTTCRNGKVYQTLINSLHCSDENVGLVWGITVGLSCLTLVSVLVALYFRHRRSIHVALLARQWCLCLLKEDNIDNDEKEYDAFISYSSDDSSVVVEKLVPGLEKLSFKLCVHERDWLGGQFISEQIVQSVQKSRRTIVVLSDNFLQSSWASLEFKMALQQALEDRVNRIIVVVPNELPNKDRMDPDLRAFVTMNTYLLCKDPRFWDKLVYSMPHRTRGGPVRRLPKDFVKLMLTQNSPKSTTEETSI